jgi:small subunit ribosomal protein S21
MATVVKARPGDSVDQMIKKFKKKVMAEEILITLKEKEFYKKPSLIRKEKLAALRRNKKR